MPTRTEHATLEREKKSPTRSNLKVPVAVRRRIVSTMATLRGGRPQLQMWEGEIVPSPITPAPAAAGSSPPSCIVRGAPEPASTLAAATRAILSPRRSPRDARKATTEPSPRLPLISNRRSSREAQRWRFSKEHACLEDGIVGAARLPPHARFLRPEGGEERREHRGGRGCHPYNLLGSTSVRINAGDNITIRRDGRVGAGSRRNVEISA